MLSDKDVKDIIRMMEMIACDFRGNMMTEEQFKKVDDAWDEVRECYLPCVIRNPKTSEKK